MTHSENALLRDAADVVNAIALLSKVYEDGSTPLMASLDGGRVIACIEALTARVSELARAYADALEENAWGLARVVNDGMARIRELERELTAERERADRLMRLAYLAGWNASGEGYNAEYPFGDSDTDPEADAKWIAVRDTALDAVRRK